MMATRSKAYRLTLRAILMAIIFIQGMVPFLGFIPLGVVNLTLIHITVIITAVTLGTADGMFVGLVWGLTTFIRAWTSPSPLDQLVFTNPLVSVLPRVLVGLVAGVTFTLIYKRFKRVFVASAAAAALGTLTNTVLVLGLMGLLHTNSVASHFGTSPSALLGVLVAIVISNGIPEIIAAVIITPLLAAPIFAGTKLSPETRGK